MVAPTSSQSLPSLKVLRYPSLKHPGFEYATFTLYGQLLQIVLLPEVFEYLKDPVTLQLAPEFRLFPFRSSLTQGISFDFFSSPYLDISVQGVALSRKKRGILPITREGISPFGHRRITAS